jgi:thiol-disulfide isomerase/thioredoxin
MTTRRTILKSALLAAGATIMQKPNLGMAAASDYGIMGRLAPELKIDNWIDENGAATSFDLARHEGKWIFLKCWQSWCPGCHSHGFPALKKISDALAGNPGIAIAGIQTVFEGHYSNTADKLREIQLRYDLRIPMGHDPGPDERRAQTMIDYRTGGTPWMILIDPARRVVFNDFGIDADKAIAFLETQTA